MVTCPSCKSINVKSLDLNFARRKKEGASASKAETPKKQFLCQTCDNEWDSNQKSEELYWEYTRLKNETTLSVQEMGPSGGYSVQYLDPNKLKRRDEIVKELMNDHQHTLDIGPSAWHDLKQDTEL